ncbi:hypothetical protein ACIQPR_18275 [Streptomyces sp. NPDC091280]|uniref:hypothetical protein n=1 Tax=Streptomyces sp. NPDC091280 TaxID=3365984 RepID=UPI00382DA399
MPEQLPHDPYADAVMEALGDRYDPAESWTAYDSDNGEVMLMELVVTLDADRARAAGWHHGLVLHWNQITGWEWMALDRDGRGNNSSPLASPTVCTPETVTQAVDQVLAPDGWRSLPTTGRHRDAPSVLPEPFTQLLAEVDEYVSDQDTAADIADAVRALASYA